MAVANIQIPYNGCTIDITKRGSSSIPIVNNVVSDDDLRKTVRPKVPMHNTGQESYLVKTLKLLTDKHYDGLAERHYRSIKKIPKFYPSGIHLKEASVLSELISRCNEMINTDTRYEDSVCVLIKMLSLPFLKSKMSEENAFLNTTSNIISTIGNIVEVASDKIKSSLASSLSKLYTVKSIETEVYEIKPVSHWFIQSALEKSSICKSIGECLGKVCEKSDQYIILRCLKILSGSVRKCDEMFKANVAKTICTILKDNVEDYDMLFVSVETLWNLLEYGSKENIESQLSNEECLRCLHDTFLYQANKTASQADRQLRNDILILISLLVSNCPRAPFTSSGITKTITLYTSLPNVSNMNDKTDKKVAQCYENFEMKKILFCIISQLCSYKDSLEIFSKYQVMLTLFSYVKPIKEPMDATWTIAEFEELQLHAMSILATLAPLCIDDYIQCQGNTRLLLLLDWCIGLEEFGGHGNSFHGVGGRGSKRAQMRFCIRLLRSVCSTGSQLVFQDMTDQGAISQLVAILSSCSSSSESNDAVDIELQCDMMFILATICDGNIHRKEQFGETGVLMTVQYLNGYLGVKNGPLCNQKLVLAATDCIWSAVHGCYSNESVFLEIEGVFLLLDLLQACPENMQNVVLGVILDLLENKNALPHILLWRGDKMKTVGKLMVEMWRAEEKKLGVKRDQYGVISDPSEPLMTVVQSSHEPLALSTSLLTASIVDVSDNIRAKIYSVFCKIGFRNTQGLDPEDFIAVTIIEKYIDFKTMEVWQEIKQELQLENIEPVPSDAEIIERIILLFQDKAIAVSKLQRALLENNDQMELHEEQTFYRKLAEGYTQAEKTYNDFMNYKERTSDFNALKRARVQQLQAIERSKMFTSNDRIKLQRDSLIEHETFDKTLQTTTFCGRNITIRSTDVKPLTDH